jgi:hypothetical protein
MGLLDSLFDPQIYGGAGGLLSRLSPSLGQFPQSQGFEQQNPIGVGGYQMPRIGNPDQYQPERVMTPPAAQPTQGQMPMPQQQQALPPALGGVGSALGSIGSALGRIGSPDGLIARLAGNDARSIAQQNLKAQYDALVPVVGPQKAMLAVMNPEAGKTILAQALEKQQPTFGVIGESDGGGKDYGFIDPTKKTVTPYTHPESENRGTVTGPDGKEIQIPPGVNAKTFRNHITAAAADAATGRKTEVQAAAEQSANRMEDAEKNFSKVSTANLGVSGAAQSAASGVPVFGNFLKSQNFQKMEQSKREWVTALLRKESGAAIGRNEYTSYDRQFFPQAGDGPEVVAQKAEARRVATNALKNSAGPAYKSPSPAPAQSAPAAQYQEGATATNPQTGQKLTFRNGKWQ